MISFRHHRPGLCGAVLLLAVAGCSQSKPSAAPRMYGREGLPYFREVAPGLYCGGQPTQRGLEELQRLGVKTIVNLRTGMLGANTPADAPFEQVHIPVVPVQMMDGEVEQFLRTVVEQDKPMYFHCLLGADRTGAMTAAYRMVVQDWPRDRAIAEMTNDGIPIGLFCHGLVDYVRNMDVVAMRQRVGLNPALADGPQRDAEIHAQTAAGAAATANPVDPGLLDAFSFQGGADSAK